MTSVLASFFNDTFPSSDLQQQALSWLVDDDSYYTSVMEAEPDELMERFVMVLFYLDRIQGLPVKIGFLAIQYVIGKTSEAALDAT